MADEYSRSLLEAWELPGLVETFQSNEINRSVMSQLSAELVKELIPKVGPRVKFMEKWTRHFSPEGIESDRCSPSCSRTKSITRSRDSSVVSTDSHDENCKTESESDDECRDYRMTRQDCFTGKKEYEKHRLFYVREIFRKSVQGEAILKSYKKTKELTRTTRNIVVDCIMSEVVNSKHHMRNDDFEQLAAKIVDVFPSENPSIYYIPAVKKINSRNRKSVPSRVKLVDKYRNLAQSYKKLALGELKTNRTGQDPKDVVEQDIDTETKESIAWLSKNQAPWEVVMSHWKTTSAIRRREIANTNDITISAIYQKWPILNHPQGYTLIDVEFRLMELTEIENDFSKWDAFFSKLRSSYHSNTRDSNAISLNELLDSTDINDDTKVTAQLLLVPHLIPPRGRIRINKRHWKPSIGECKDSLIMHAIIAGDVAVLQEKRMTAMQTLSLRMQPFIIVVGSDITRISSSYVYVDQILYKVDSTIAALDICFKVFHAFHAAYPPESEHIWLVLQEALYQFKPKWDKQIAYVAEIMSHLKNNKDSTV